MAVPLTEKQQAVLEFIRGFLREQGLPPTVREIGEYFGLDPHAVHDHLKALERKGCLKRSSSKARSLRLVQATEQVATKLVPIAGHVQAGLPLLAVENIEGALPVAEEWLGEADAFFLKVKGDSMMGVHIQDGDYVLVRQQAVAEEGDIVVALLDGEATVKRFFYRGRTVLLRPENPAMTPIEVKGGDLQILGKVIGVLRKL